MRKPLFLAVLIVSAFLAAPAAAQTGSEILLRPFRLTDQLELSTDARFHFESDTDNQTAAGANHDFRVDVYDLHGRLRLSPGESETGLARAQPRAGFAMRYFQLHTSDPSLPDELFDGSIAAAMGIFARDGWLGGLSVGVGHTGADFERDANALYLQGTLAIGKTFENGDAFGFAIEFNGNRTFLPDVPLPGFQYRRRLDPPRRVGTDPAETPSREVGGLEGYDPEADQPRLVFAVGVPFSEIEWRATDRLRFELTYAIPQNLSARVDYTLMGDPDVSGVGIYGSLTRSVGAFHWNELPGRDRLFFRQNLAEAGLNWRLHDRLELVIAGGVAFNQEFTTSWDTRDTDNVAEVDSAPYLRALARLRL